MHTGKVSKFLFLNEITKVILNLPFILIHCLYLVSETTADVTALQWMEKEETSGKEKPYLYTQCQSRFCRSLFPCQDTPGVKFPYTANVTLEKG